MLCEGCGEKFQKVGNLSLLTRAHVRCSEQRLRETRGVLFMASRRGWGGEEGDGSSEELVRTEIYFQTQTLQGGGAHRTFGCPQRRQGYLIDR